MEGHRGLVNSRSRLLPSLLGSRRGEGGEKRWKKRELPGTGQKEVPVAR